MTDAARMIAACLVGLGTMLALMWFARASRASRDVEPDMWEILEELADDSRAHAQTVEFAIVRFHADHDRFMENGVMPGDGEEAHGDRGVL